MDKPHKIPVEEQFRIMADTAPVLIWISGVDKLCYFFNKGWLDFTGRTLEQEFGNGWAEGVHPDDLEHCLEIYIESFNRRVPFKMEYRLRRHDGQFRWLLDTGVPRYTEKGEFAGYIGSCVDIQELKETELAKDEFISIAGHELKTPLTTLMVSAELLDKLFASDTSSHYIPQVLQTSKSSIKKLETIINDLLDVGIIKDGRMQLHLTRFKFDQLINECRTYFELTSTKKFEITGNWNIPVWADAKKIEQVLMNMLHNALKYAPSSEKIIIHIEENDGFIRISVKDFGPGIPEENLPFIFDRYFRGGKRLNNHTSGFGLGLYISREIVRQHNGDMGVESIIGKGSTFWFTLPANNPVPSLKHKNA